VGLMAYCCDLEGKRDSDYQMFCTFTNAENNLKAEAIQPSTKPMATEAIKTGYYEHKVTGRSFPKIKILTIEGLLDGKERPQYPDLSQGGMTFKKSKVEEKIVEQKKLF